MSGIHVVRREKDFSDILVWSASTVGFDVAQETFTIYGSPETRVTFTSKKDIGKSIARLAFLSMSPSASSVPSHVRICGTAASAKDIAEAITDEVPSKQIKIVGLKVEEEKLKLKEGYLSGEIVVPAMHIRYGPLSITY